MPHVIAIEKSESQRRQLSEKIRELDKQGWPLSGKYEAQTFGTWESVFENAVTPGLFAQREVIVIENAETLGEFPDSLSGLLEDDKADSIIILVFNAASKTLNPVKSHVTFIKPEEQIPPWKRQSWLMSLARSEKFTLSKEAAQLLADNIESQEELRSELRKLGVYSGGREIGIQDVESLSFDEGGRAQMKFLDGVCENKPLDVSGALKHLRSQPLLVTLTAITNRLRPALILALFGESVVKALGASNYALKESRIALKNYGGDAIRLFMSRSIRLSYLEKTNRSEGWPGFELILWELMSKF